LDIQLVEEVNNLIATNWESLPVDIPIICLAPNLNSIPGDRFDDIFSLSYLVKPLNNFVLESAIELAVTQHDI
jgi:hypothetical protein